MHIGLFCAIFLRLPPKKKKDFFFFFWKRQRVPHQFTFITFEIQELEAYNNCSKI